MYYSDSCGYVQKIAGNTGFWTTGGSYMKRICTAIFPKFGAQCNIKKKNISASGWKVISTILLKMDKFRRNFEISVSLLTRSKFLTQKYRPSDGSGSAIFRKIFRPSVFKICNKSVELPTKFNIFGPPILAGSTFFLQKVNLSDNTDYAIFKIIFPSAVVLTATKYAVIINKYHNLFNGAYVLVLIGVYWSTVS